MRPVSLGEFELLVMLAALRLGPEEAYTVSIADDIQRKTNLRMYGMPIFDPAKSVRRRAAKSSTERNDRLTNRGAYNEFRCVTAVWEGASQPFKIPSLVPTPHALLRPLLRELSG